jgi:hypothetical protein
MMCGDPGGDRLVRLYAPVCCFVGKFWIVEETAGGEWCRVLDRNIWMHSMC